MVMTQIADSEAASVARWPIAIVTSINEDLPVKPGATILAERHR